jgi:CheY-like chemotaxis protein
LAPDQPIYRILIIEDKWANRRLLVHMLKPLGFEVREAEDGQIGISLWESWQPHLIFMDMRMPILDGYEATQRIKATVQGQKTPIIALTASAFEEDRSVVLSAGCDDFLRKPFREVDVFEALERHLGVAFVYAENSQAATPSDVGVQDALSPEALAVLPTDWVRDLHQAAVQGDTDRLCDIVEHIRERNPSLADHLLYLANTFQFEQIVHASKLS